MAGPAQPARDASGRWLYPLVVLMHLGLTLYFVSPAAVFGDEPLSGDDFDLHIGQTFRAVEGLQRWGHSWVYDVDLLAGNPAGVIVDSGNKGWSLWTYAGESLGLSRAVAFNTFVLFGHLLAPIAVFLCARLFGLAPRVAALAAGFASLYWFFDSFTHWVWWVGMCSYATASSFALIPLGLFNRFIVHGSRLAGAAAAPLLGLSLLIHPYSFFILVVPMGLLYLRAARGLARGGHLLVGAIVLTAVGINGYWLHNALTHWHYILDSAYFGQTGLVHLITDYFSIVLNPTDTGVVGTRTGFRFLFCAMAVAGTVALHRAGDRRLLPLSVTLGVLLVLAYLGGHLPGVTQIQPYRHVVPVGFVAAILAAAFVEHLRASSVLRDLAFGARAALLIAALIGVQHLSRDVLYFIPDAVPEAPPLIDDTPSPVTGYGYLSHFRKPEQLSFRLPHPPLIQYPVDVVVDWVQQHVPAGHRIVVDNAVMGERIAWKTGVEVLGGFRERNIDHSYANFMRRFAREAASREDIERYVRLYAVSYFVMRDARKDLDAATHILRRAPGPPGVIVYRVIEPVRFVFGGPGELRASTNRIEVTGTDPSRAVTLAYHYHEALRCRPDCRVERKELPPDRVGMIRVPAPHPPDFVIENGY